MDISKVLNVLIDGSVNHLEECCGNFPLFECEQEQQRLSLQLCVFVFKLIAQLFLEVWPDIHQHFQGPQCSHQMVSE